MKNYLFAISLLAALVFLQGASVWEGAAAVSADFPDSGLYVATNSFPKNTVVDLTNLETGKTVRVIVTAGLDTPGLLALISKEAADAVGLRSRTIGRIRMISPQDPVAFSRFSEEYRSGDPDYDPLAAVEEKYGKEIASTPNPPSGPSTVPHNGTDSSHVPDTPSRSDPDSYWPDPVTVAPITPHEPERETATSDIPPDYTLSTTDLLDTYMPEPTVVISDFEDIPETSDAIAMVSSSRDPVLTDLPRDAIPQPVVPPPVESVVGPPHTPPPTPPGSKETTPEYSYTLIPAEERPPQAVTPGTTVPQIFSVPSVAELEKGKYYLQLGAYSHTAIVEQELCRVERNYPLAVQYVTVSGKNVYRILIGPVNQGESGALLKKFKSLGYKDAFVRRGN